MSADLYAETTARIIEALEHGTPPWVRPWSTIPDAMPMNAQSRRPYRGINFTLLSLVAEQHGYAVNRWLTFRQALDLGAHVRKGEQGTPIVFWQLRRIGVVADAFPEHDDDPPELRGKVYPLLRSFTVFNVAQTDGLDPQLHRAKRAHLGARSESRGAAAHVGCSIPAGRRASVLPAGQRRDPLARTGGIRQCVELLQRRPARTHALVGASGPLQSRPDRTLW